METPISEIAVGARRRTVNRQKVAELAESIQDIGLLNPVSVNRAEGGYLLIAGLHRLEAAKVAGWATIPATLVTLGDLDAELAEIDENLIRSELSVLEKGDHLTRREEILSAKLQRAPSHRPSKGEFCSPLRTTADIAREAGIGERTAQHYKQISRDLDPEAKDRLRDTPTANSKTDLLKLSRMDSGTQRQAEELVREACRQGWYRLERQTIGRLRAGWRGGGSG